MATKKKAKRKVTAKRTTKRKVTAKRAKKKNPAPKMKNLTRSTGWMDAKKVKIVKRGRRVDVLVKR